MADWFAECFPGEKVRFCHQLDHATSGVLLMASNKAAGKVGSQLFEKRLARKRYWALTLGHPRWTGEVLLQHRIADGEGFARRVPAPDEPGEEAQTLAKVLSLGHWPRAPTSQAAADGKTLRPPVEAALVELQLLTGRRHQIRVHLAAEGFPVLGDDAYGGHPWGDRAGSYRMFLHSRELAFQLGNGEEVQIIAPCAFADELLLK